METHRLCVKHNWVRLLCTEPLGPRIVRTVEPAEDRYLHCDRSEEGKKAEGKGYGRVMNVGSSGAFASDVYELVEATPTWVRSWCVQLLAWLFLGDNDEDEPEASPGCCIILLFACQHPFLFRFPNGNAWTWQHRTCR